MTALTDEMADQLQAERTRASNARCALAFVRGVLVGCQRFGQPVTPALVAAMLRECNEGLEVELDGRQTRRCAAKSC